MSQPYKSGRQQNLNLGITSVTENRTVLQTIGKVGIGTTTAQQHSLFVVGSTNITGNINVGGASTFVGVGTFNNNLYVANQLYVGGVSITGGATVGADITTRNLLASGISTLTGQVNANGGLDVTGHTELDNLNVSGIATINNLNVQTGFDVYDTQAVFHNDVRIAGNLSIGGTATAIFAQDLRVFDKEITLGITTDAFGNDISNDDTANHGGISIASTVGSPLVDLALVGYSTLPKTYKQLMWVAANSYGVGTTDAWMFNYAVGVGSTQVPNGVRFAVSGIQFTDDTINTPNLSATKNLNVLGISTLAGNGGITTTGGDLYVGRDLYIKNDLFLDELTARNINITGLTTVGVVSARSVNATGIITANSFRPSSGFIQAADGTNSFYIYNGSGNVAFQGTIGASSINNGQGYQAINFSANANPTVLIPNDLNVSGFSTFTRFVDANGGLDVTGGSTLDRLNVTGVSTFAGLIDSNGGLDVTGQTTLNNTLSVTGVSTFTGLVDANGGLDVAGGSTLDRLNVTGVSTFTGPVNANGGVVVTGGSNIFGGSTLDRLNVTGISTFAGLIDSNGGLDVAGGSTLDRLNVTGVSTFVGFATFQNNVSIAGSLDVNGNINFNGSLFQNNQPFIASRWTATSNGLDIYRLSNVGIGTSTLLGALTVRGDSNISGVVTATTFNGQVNAGVGTITTLNSTNATLTNISSSGISTLGTTSATNLTAQQLSVSGVSTFINGPILVGSATSTGTSTQTLQVTGGAYVSGNLGVGVTTPTSKLQVQGDVLVSGVVTATTFNGQVNAGVGTITTLNSANATITNINSTGISTLGIVTASQLYVSGVSTLATLHAPKLTYNGTDFGGSEYLAKADGSGGWTWASVPGIFSVNNILNGFNVSDEGFIVGTAGSITQLDFRGNNIAATANPQPNGIATIRVSDTPSFLALTVTSGITTLGVTTATSLFSNQLSVSGLSTFIGVGTFRSDLYVGGNLYIQNDLVFDEATVRNINVTGVSTLGIANATNLNVTGVVTATTLSTGASGTGINITSNTISGPSTLIIDPAAVGDNTGAVRIRGDLYVDGSQFIVNSTTIDLADFNVGIATTVGTNLLLDGAGIGIGSTNIRKNLTYDYTNDALKSSENFNIPSGKTYKINGVDVLSSTTLGSSVVNSSLTSVGTLTQLNVSGVSTLSGNVQIGSAITAYAATGIISATAFYGDGSNLANTGSTLNAASGTQRLVLTSQTTGTMTQSATNSDLVYNSSTNTLSGTNFAPTQLRVTGVSTFSGPVSTGSTTGVSGQYLQSTGVGVTWATFPTLRTTQTNVATNGQTIFSFGYNVNFLDVFINGVKLTSSEYTATNGTTITLGSPAFANDIVEFISYNTTSVGGGGGGGATVLDDLSDVALNLPPAAGENLTYDGSNWVNDYTVTTTTSTTSQTTLHSLSASSYRSVEYMIQATQGTNYHVTKVLSIHDGTLAYPTEYGTLYTNGSLGTFDVDVSGGNMRLRVTPASSSSTTYKIKFTAIKV